MPPKKEGKKAAKSSSKDDSESLILNFILEV